MEQSKSSDAVSLKKTPFVYIFFYALGSCAFQIPFNAMWAFAQLYYAQVLGLNYLLTGIVMFLPMLWDAVSDPLMGHISDNTRSRFGKRHPYIFFGGLGVALSFFLLWSVPEIMASHQWSLFLYLLLINLIFRTAITVFMVPYGALGFEVCTDYDQRSTLQGTSCVVAMMANLFGIALSWKVFFSERDGVDGALIAENYFGMGVAFSVFALVMMLVSLIATKRYIRDTRNDETVAGNGIKEFYENVRDIFLDKRAVLVFIFLGIAQFGGALVACWQSYVWIYYMEFSGGDKTLCHSIGMIGFVLAALTVAPVSKILDKKITVCLGAGMSVFGNLALLLIFYTGFMGKSVTYPMPEWMAGVYNGLPAWMQLFDGANIPISVLVFSVFQAIFWMGPGWMAPMATSMIADISEINKYHTGILKDGSYSAVFTFSYKLTSSVALLVQSVFLGLIGFQEKSETQTAEAIDRLVLVTFLSGIVCAVIAMLVAMKHNINRSYMARIKAELANRAAQETGEASSS